MGENVIIEKSKRFAVRIIRLYQKITKNQHEYNLSVQLLRSGTSIGANVKEATQGQSRADFISKMYIALKEASETEYWLELLKETDYISIDDFLSLNSDCKELIKLLTSIIKSSKEKK